MKMKSFKKFFVSIALSAVLTLSSASSIFAATALLVPAEQTAELTQENASDTPAVESSEAPTAGASLSAQSGISQTAASETSVTKYNCCKPPDCDIFFMLMSVSAARVEPLVQPSGTFTANDNGPDTP